jgi:hypothetical protein
VAELISMEERYLSQNNQLSFAQTGSLALLSLDKRITTSNAMTLKIAPKLTVV